ncbi:MAG: trehalose-phosphatase, partial [Proteobacteria bacterium]
AHRAQAVKAARAVKAWHKTIRKELGKEPGLLVEDKKYSLSIHYRETKDRAKAKAKILSVLEMLDPAPDMQPGKCVINLMIEGHAHKGMAVQQLLKTGKYPRALFVGDDITDEDVFRMQDPRIFSIRVGKRKGSLAQAYVESQSEMLRVLRMLVNVYTE